MCENPDIYQGKNIIYITNPPQLEETHSYKLNLTLEYIIHF